MASQTVRHVRILIIILVWLSGFAPAITRADEGDDRELTEIVIRGLPRSTKLFDYPGSATVIRSSQLAERGSRVFQDVIDTIPDLNHAGGSNRPRFFQIRGIGEVEQYEGAPNPSVGVLIDGIDYSGLGIPIQLFDIDQIDVLRGPQAIRFGSSALAGAIDIQSAGPYAEPEAIAELGVGNDDMYSGAVAVGGAIPGTQDQLQVRISSAHLQSDGFRDNLFLDRDDTNRREAHTTRMKVLLEPSKEAQFGLTLLAIDNPDRYDVFAIDNGFDTQSDRPGEDALSSNAAALNGRVMVAPELALETLSTIAYTDQDYSFDGDWGNNPFWEPYTPYDYFSQTDRRRHMWSQELRLLRDDPAAVHGESAPWVVGGYLQRLDENTEINELFEVTPYRTVDSDYRADTWALFGQQEIPIVRGTSIQVGGRVEHRSMEYNDSNAVTLSPDDTMLGAQLALNHDISESLRGYLSASRGFKGGGFNAGTLVPEEQRLYDPEYLWSFEIGVKGSALENRLSGSVDVFYAQRDDAQLKFAFQNDPADPLSFTYVTDSVAEGRNLGLEAEGSYQLTSHWVVFGSTALIDTEYTSVPDGNPGLDGRDQSHAPSWQYGVGTTYNFTEHWFVRLDLTGKDSFYFDDSHNQTSDPYHLAHASAGYRSERWSLTAWTRNIFDERYAVRGFFFGNEPPNFESKEYVQRGDPLAVGMTLAVHL